jgi:putative FmdB family regulatory protein
MPIYEYVCEDCGTKFEKLVLRASDKEELACPSCGQSRLEQQLSTFAPHASAGSSQPSMPQCPSAGGCPRAGMCGMN